MSKELKNIINTLIGVFILYVLPIGGIILIIYGSVVLNGKSNIKNEEKNKIGGILLYSGISLFLVSILIWISVIYYGYNKVKNLR
jgi:hypothetical protein